MEGGGWRMEGLGFRMKLSVKVCVYIYISNIHVTCFESRI